MNKTKNTIVISAFPACGKTYFFENTDKYTVLDSDSSKFHWIYRKRTPEELEEAKEYWKKESHLLSEEGYINKIKDEIIRVPNPEFPQNYVEHIKKNIGKVDFILVSSHKEVRDILEAAGIDFWLFFPGFNCKAEWVGRCFLRGSNDVFCRLIADNYDKWTEELRNDTKHRKFVLRPNEYLSDGIDVIINYGLR